LDNVILVDNTAEAFAEASANWYGNPAKKLKLLGITGTNGKTSTTYMIKSILEAAGKKVGLIGTNQNMICDRVIPSINTTPHAFYLNELFADMVDSGCEYVIMEVSSIGLKLNRVDNSYFDIGIITNFPKSHNEILLNIIITPWYWFVYTKKQPARIKNWLFCPFLLNFFSYFFTSLI
jgi:UDP-N-acetylmuramoyl-L-alanyl-D-glutamate--2,6-diaminopimelate ligase